jgi:hypothetical protein
MAAIHGRGPWLQLRQGGTHPLDDRENFLRLHGPYDALVDGDGCRHGGVLGGAQVGGGAGRAEIPGQPRRVHEGPAAMGKLQVLLLLLLEVLQVGGRQGAIGSGRRRAVGAAAAGMEGGHIGGGGPCRRSCCPNPGVVSPAAEGCGGLGRARWRVDPCIARAAAAGAALVWPSVCAHSNWSVQAASKAEGTVQPRGGRTRGGGASCRRRRGDPLHFRQPIPVQPRGWFAATRRGRRGSIAATLPAPSRIESEASKGARGGRVPATPGCLRVGSRLKLHQFGLAGLSRRTGTGGEASPANKGVQRVGNRGCRPFLAL